VGALIAGLLLVAVPGYGQQIAPLLHQPLAPFGQGIEFGVDKITNTFVWIGNADVTLPSFAGDFRLTNRYRASAFRTVTTATRDDEAFQLAFTRPLDTLLNVVARQGYILSRDSRSVGLNALERFNLAAGFRMEDAEVGFVEAIGGLESSTQLGVGATGPLAAVTGELRPWSLDQWMITGSALADWQRLDDRRTNTDLDVKVDVARPLAEGSTLRLAVQTVDLGREFFTNLTGASTLDVEQRSERRVAVNGDVTYAVLPELTLGLVSALATGAVDRSYDEPVTGVALSAVERQLRELTLDVEGYAQVLFPSLSFIGGAALYRRTEQNGVANVHGLDADDLEAVRAQESQRDNTTMRTRLFGRGEWYPSALDTIRIDVSGWLLRYDTPSDANDDDRDELASIATLTYARRLGRSVTMSLGLSGQYLHLVFLKATRSALNNVNRVLRLSPSFRVTGSTVVMQPQFEILANYTVYDYEGTASSVRSFSFRQVSYRDSILVRLTPTLTAESQVLLRYFERSTLLWSDFAETPQTGNLEYLAKLLIFSQPDARWRVGAGIRLYTLEQRTIVTGLPSMNAGSVHSIGPEAALQFNTGGGSVLTLSGWYEFQTINLVTRRELPNLLLRAVVRI
jgi:hypothetical protein